MLLPLLRLSHIPFRYDFKLFGLAYLLVGAEAVFFASLLYLVLAPTERMQSFAANLRRDRGVRAAILLLYFAVLLWTIPILKAVFVVVATASFLEIVQANRSSHSRKKALRLIKPSSYLFIGLLLVSSYNDIILLHSFLFWNLSITASFPSLASALSLARSVMSHNVECALSAQFLPVIT